MALTDWIQTAAVVYFAWQQNQIFKRQNEIFAKEAGSTAMAKSSQVFWVARYWPTLVMVVLMGLTGYDIYARHGAPPAVPWWFYVLLLFPVAAIALVTGRLTVRPTRVKEPSKLVIHSATYTTWTGEGKSYDVTEYLRSIITGDSLAFGPIENHSFWVDGRNLVPDDPLSGKPKKLEVKYSYDGKLRNDVRRAEHDLLTLPEDSGTAWLGKELNKAKAEIDRLRAAGPKPVQYPIPEVRLKIVSLVSELQGFMGAHGEEPKVPTVHKELGESNEDFLVRFRANQQKLEPVMKWRAKFLGDYRQEFMDKVSRLRDEMRSRAHIDDSVLNIAIDRAEKDSNEGIGAVQGIIKRLWELAVKVNV